MNKFIEDTPLKNNIGQSLKITMITENQADKFVAGVKQEIEEYKEAT